MNGRVKTAEKNVDPLTRRRGGREGQPGFYVGEAGAASSRRRWTSCSTTQLGNAGMRSLPLTLLILTLVFGSLLAGVVPLLLGSPRYWRRSASSSLDQPLVPMDETSAPSSCSSVSRSASTTRCSIYAASEKNEPPDARRAQRWRPPPPPPGASVLISGATVIIAMAGMLLSGDRSSSGSRSPR